MLSLFLLPFSASAKSPLPPAGLHAPGHPGGALIGGAALAELASTFSLPAPSPELRGQPLRLWSTHYILYETQEVALADGIALVGVDEQGFPAPAPVHLSERDWCMSALEGSARVVRLDGSVLTVNYAGVGALVVDCGPSLGNARWRTQGTVRFGEAVGPYGDGVQGYALVPFRTLATDPATIPTGSVVYVPDAVGVTFTHAGQEYAHDGYFFAADVGGAIRGDHVDTFTGTAASPFPHVGDSPGARFDAFVLPEGHPVQAVLSSLH